MSQQLVERIFKKNPKLVKPNIVPNNFALLVLIRDALRAAGHKVEHIAKVQGERGQYAPPGFGRVQVTGFDGTGYTAIGVSHDALYVDDVQHDVIGAANFLHEEIFNEGKLVEAFPVFNEVPRHEWRAWNPPLPQALEHGRPTTPGQPPPPPARMTLPDYGSMGDAPFFIGEVGNPFADDYKEAKQKLNGGFADWIARCVHSLMASFVEHGDHRNKAAIVKKHRNELREALKLKPIP